MEAQFRARRLLMPPSPSPAPALGPDRPGILEALPDAEPNSPAAGAFSSLDANVIIVLSFLLCGLICTLALNAIVRCACRVTRRVCYSQEGPESLDIPPGPAEARPARKGALRALPTLVYSAGLGLAGSGSECAICLADFERGDRVRLLPRCNHGFHVRCIDRWLAARPTCPTCRQVLFLKKAGRPLEAALAGAPARVAPRDDEEGL